MDTPNEKALAKEKLDKSRHRHWFKIIKHEERLYRFFWNASGAHKPTRSAHVEFSVANYWHGFGFGIDIDENSDEMFTFSLYLGIVNIWLGINFGYRTETSWFHNPKWKAQKWSIALFNSWQVFDLSLGHNDNSWDSKRDLWGKYNEKARLYLTYEKLAGGHTHRYLTPKVLPEPKELEIIIPAYKGMPDMPVTLSVVETRAISGPRFWFKTEYQRLEVNIVSEKKPKVHGKGENSWDCDDEELSNLSFWWQPRIDGPWQDAARNTFIKHVHEMIDRRGVAS
jgi:hypothetical protein